MGKTLRDIIPYLVTGEKYASEERMFEAVSEMQTRDMMKIIVTFPERYKEESQMDLGGYTGLVLFTEIIKQFRAQSYVPHSHRDFVRLCEKEVLYYHNLQYEQSKNKNETSI